MSKEYKISVVGSGYVGLSLAILLAQQNNVTILDIDKSKVEKINNKISPIDDVLVKDYLSRDSLKINATTNIEDAYNDADYVIVSTPTNFDETSSYFDTSSVDKVVNDCRNLNSNCQIVIKSTLPIGHTKKLQKKHNTDSIFFSPEFLREGNALYDNLYPSRIIIGSQTDQAKDFASLLESSALKDDIDIIFIGSTEAESVKLFANSYLAMRVAFFNELDSFAISRDLKAKEIIESISLDPRIGSGYNNTSFGYGGYCLPKDTKQLEANFKDIPQSIISAIVSSNRIRKDFITKAILALQPKVIGIHRLQMKSGSDNFRFASIQGIMKRLSEEGVEMIIHEPLIEEDNFDGFEIVNEIDSFKIRSDIIVTNRNSELLDDVSDKVYSRDIFGVN